MKTITKDSKLVESDAIIHDCYEDIRFVGAKITEQISTYVDRGFITLQPEIHDKLVRVLRDETTKKACKELKSYVYYGSERLMTID